MLPHENMTDRQLMRWYEVARRHPQSADCEATRCELGQRVRASGGVLTDVDRGVCYVWDAIERSLVRRNLVHHRKPRKPVYEPHIGTVVLARGGNRIRRRGRTLN